MSGLLIGTILIILSAVVGLVVYFVMKNKKGDSGPPVVVDVPQEMRCSSAPWGPNSAQRADHNRGGLDSPQGWSAASNSPGAVWYQMDNGKFATISGVAIKGRRSSDQWVKTFKVKYRENNVWKNVDGGATFEGNTDAESQVVVMFKTPVIARYIRIYPETYNAHMSLRAGLVTNSTNNGSSYGLLGVPGSNRTASSWWDDTTWHPRNGVLNSGSGWHVRNGSSGNDEWYEMKLSSARQVGGVAIQGRGDGHPQWITEFKAKYKNAADQWIDVDNGFTFSGAGDNNTTVWALFNTPVVAKSIKIYPTAYYSWPTGRFDLLGF